MKELPKGLPYYTVNDLAEEWDLTDWDILYCAGIEALEICLPNFYGNAARYCCNSEDEYSDRCSKWGGSIVPIRPEEAWQIRSDEYWIGSVCSELIVSHEEKLRFEQEHLHKQKELSIRERNNLLRIIGALIEIYYKGNRYRKSDGSPNANTISEEFHNQLEKRGFSEKGMSERKIRELIPEAYDKIKANSDP